MNNIIKFQVCHELDCDPDECTKAYGKMAIDRFRFNSEFSSRLPKFREDPYEKYQLYCEQSVEDELVTFVPICSSYLDDVIIRYLENLIRVSEEYKVKKIHFDLMELKNQTSYYGCHGGFNFHKSGEKIDEKMERSQWCCYAHYYLQKIKKALIRIGYSSPKVGAEDICGNLSNEVFTTRDGKELSIYADAGM